MRRWTHGPVAGVVIAEDGEAPALPESGRSPQGVVTHSRRHDDARRVRGAGGEIPVQVAQPPLVCLGEKRDGGSGVWVEGVASPPPLPAGALPSPGSPVRRFFGSIARGGRGASPPRAAGPGVCRRTGTSSSRSPPRRGPGAERRWSWGARGHLGTSPPSPPPRNPHPRPFLMATSQLQARAGTAECPCKQSPGAGCLPTVMTDPEQTLQAATFSCQPFAARSGSGTARPPPGAHLDGAGDVQTLLHARDLQLQHLQVFAPQRDGAGGAGEPGEGSGVRASSGAARAGGDSQQRGAAPRSPGGWSKAKRRAEATGIPSALIRHRPHVCLELRFPSSPLLGAAAPALRSGVSSKPGAAGRV